MPLSLVAVGSALDRERYEVVIVDGRLESRSDAALLRRIDAATVCVGVTVLTGAPIRDAVAASRREARGAPGAAGRLGRLAPVAVPGRNAWRSQASTPPWQARARRPSASWSTRFEEGRDLDRLRGCAHRRPGGGVAVEPPRELSALNPFPSHDYGLLPSSATSPRKGGASSTTSPRQGCRFRCAFCADPFVYKRGWVGVSRPRAWARSSESSGGAPLRRPHLPGRDILHLPPRVTAVAEEFLRRGLRSPGRRRCAPTRASGSTEEVLALCRRSRPAPGHDRRRVGVAGDDGLASRRTSSWSRCSRRRREDRSATASRAIFPFIVGFPDESGRERARRAGRGQAAAARCPPTSRRPIFYFSRTRARRSPTTLVWRRRLPEAPRRWRVGRASTSSARAARG